uniref:Uncharacterized protein n=1 Tax=Peronospora matthiolae TaxID=2874970 RepID=A0AAV1TWK3_9STRA
MCATVGNGHSDSVQSEDLGAAEHGWGFQMQRKLGRVNRGKKELEMGNLARVQQKRKAVNARMSSLWWGSRTAMQDLELLDLQLARQMFV